YIVGTKGAAIVIGHKPDGGLRFEGVQPGDHLEFIGGRFYRIRRVVAADQLELGDAHAPTNLEADVPAPAGPNPPPNYRIIRQPQKDPGADAVPLPEGWAIDLSPAAPRGAGLSTDGMREILFAPNGQVTFASPELKVIRLWLRGPPTAAA